MTCINPECRNGLVPGLCVAGNGTHDGARPGARMQWKPVACPACRPQPKGPRYVPVRRTDEQIAERWKLAESRAPYDSRSAPAQNGAVNSAADPLEAIHARTPSPAPSATATQIRGDVVAERIATALEKLVSRVEILTGAVLELCEREEPEHPISNPLVTLEEVLSAPSSRIDILIGLLQQLVDNASFASRPTETGVCDRTTVGEERKPVASRSSSAKTKGGSGRKRGGTSARSTA